MKFLQFCLLGSIAFSANAFAQQHTVSLGYAQTDVEDILDLKGVNVQYRYETSSPVSLLASMSYQTGDENWNDQYSRENLDVKHFSLLAGPAYRFNPLVSAYAVVGIAYSTVDSEYSEIGYSENYDFSESNLAYGVGVIVTPTDKLSLNIGYEGTEVESAKLNGFNMGVGYRF